MKLTTKLTALLLSVGTLLSNAANAQTKSPETGFNMPALNPQSPPAAIHGGHIGIRVPDYEAAIKWHLCWIAYNRRFY